MFKRSRYLFNIHKAIMFLGIVTCSMVPSNTNNIPLSACFIYDRYFVIRLLVCTMICVRRVVIHNARDSEFPLVIGRRQCVL